jgi:hypothetical protein
MSKRAVLILLVGLNLLLLAVLLLSTYTPPAAFAQGLTRGGEFLLLTARAEQSNDAIYLLDLRTRQLHVYRTNFPRAGGEVTRVTWRASRDLIRDFGG